MAGCWSGLLLAVDGEKEIGTHPPTRSTLWRGRRICIGFCVGLGLAFWLNFFVGWILCWPVLWNGFFLGVFAHRKNCFQKAGQKTVFANNSYKKTTFWKGTQKQFSPNLLFLKLCFDGLKESPTENDAETSRNWFKRTKRRRETAFFFITAFWKTVFWNKCFLLQKCFFYKHHFWWSEKNPHEKWRRTSRN